ncbi:hypothetical protein A2Y99_02435 [Candidatus Gottesmanbacteria bacterium RBG_13_37_7]|uniref:Undecaprenyl-phosphate alpha-N-acetylglucosaminyl 1-phosphate transferase n=1 Tax=Candidatus Gottesmanbacteria bacterium RBG_13_37_7 TaxID=1798369 RepID=A0A1F5YJ15_9BACT|nr:MAG: hypothetical protein A2Y99_02435 [Candidatus Gottesmanbacteria bacterium RBG_13_37_7]
MLITILLLIVISSVISYCLTPLIIVLAKKYNLVDNPKIRPHPAHTHQGVIPRAGGVSLFLGIFIPALFFLQFNTQLVSIFIGCLLIVLMGLWDDKKHRSPYIRLFINAAIVLLIILSGITPPYITNPLGGILHLDKYFWSINIWENSFVFYPFSSIVAFIWIYWTMNIVGWSGGVDGQLPGFVAITSFFIGILSLRFAAQDQNQLQVTYLSFLTAGSFLGFLPWNFFPQKIMPGYGGKTLAGFILAIISTLSFSKLGTATLILAIPMADAAFMLIKRILSGKSPLFATSNHLHHHLLKLGWGKKKIAIFYWVISAIAGIIAISVNSQQKIFVGILALVVISGFILWINLLKKIPVNNTG